MVRKSFELSTDENLVIRGDIEAPGGAPGATVVCVHGFKGFKDWGFWPHVARRLRESGRTVVRFNFSHSGIGRDGKTFTETDAFESGTYSREVDDLHRVLRALVRKEIPGSEVVEGSRLALIGHSRGAVSVLAATVAADPPVKSVVLWNPVASVLWWDEAERRRWRERGFWEVVNTRTGQRFHVRTGLLDDAESNRDRLDPMENARRLAAPLLVVVASRDESVPPDSGRRLARAAPQGLATLREIPEIGHTFGAVHPFRESPPPLEEAIGSTLEHLDRAPAHAA